MLKVPDRDLKIWINGELKPLQDVCVPLDSPSVLAGWGAFETLCIVHGIPVEWDAHADRFNEALKALGGQWDRDQTYRGALKWASQGVDFGWLKLLHLADLGVVIFGGRNAGGVSGLAAQGSFRDIQKVRAVTLPWPKPRQRALQGHKLTSWAETLAGFQYASEQQVDEGLWLDDSGFLAELTAANLFIVREGRLCSPKLSAAVLPGITRSIIISLTGPLGVLFEEVDLHPQQLFTADEAFVTSSVQGVRALVECDGRRVGKSKKGQVTASFAQHLWQQRIKESLGKRV